ncbi:uncharacterized protein HaLaN_04818, partial [Haematococcus lacustris]
MACTTPRIDVYDHSQGSAAPAYALSPAITALGSDYCFFGLGCGAVAVYSLATGKSSCLAPSLSHAHATRIAV